MNIINKGKIWNIVKTLFDKSLQKINIVLQNIICAKILEIRYVNRLYLLKKKKRERFSPSIKENRVEILKKYSKE